MNCKRARIVVSGAVQGVGFRPFVYRLANELRLNGWVSNSAQGVLIEVEGVRNQLEEFLARLESEKPPLAIIQNINRCFLEAVPYDHFEIHGSEDCGAKTALILPDIATCEDCRREILDSKDRRYLYPFTNCTNCGPRFSIIEALPYDRANTSMREFVMCAECEREYHDPNNRRFHAQPNACPKCGPRLELWNAAGDCLTSEHEALLNAAAAIRDGKIVAVKGIGGFQLIADARNEEMIRRLRERKRREEKPFALMFPSIEAVRGNCSVGGLEEQLLLSPAAPIVLLRKLPGETQARFPIAPAVAPRNPYLGVMLPFSPLHHLLLRALGFPVVATSGNVSDESICTDEREALERLREIADAFLVHNRPIARHMDDSVVRVMAGREMILRRARGYAPLPVAVVAKKLADKKDFKSEPPCVGCHEVLGVGAHLKNTVALGIGNQAFVSQHIGDLETAQAFFAFRKSAADLPRLYEASLEIIAHDLHPEYLSTKFARQLEIPGHGNHSEPRFIGVQHHYAHILSCMADNELDAPALGVSWDGTGFGMDGTIWGGEFLLIDETSFARFAHFRPFRLPGGDAAVKQPRRSALGLLHEIFGVEVFDEKDLRPVRNFLKTELRMLKKMLAGGINSPLTSSAGRLFDAVASIIGLRQRASFEGRGAMELEFASAPGIEGAYPFVLRKATPLVFDWQPMILEILKELRQNRPIAVMAAKFHNTLTELIVAVAHFAGEKNVVLSGGCFQNQYLTERTVRRLREEGFVPYWHRRIPPNDGGIALGQVVAALRAAAEVGSKPDGREDKISPQLMEIVFSP
jgi:hydrogenase maturation protein HypF